MKPSSSGAPKTLHILVVLTALVVQRSTLGDTWQAGVARARITPSHSMWMAGYAHRDRPAEGTLTDLWAKALLLRDPAGETCVLITLDLIGIDRELSKSICDALAQQHGLTRSQIALCCSHTHTGPVVALNLRPMHFDILNSQQQQQVTEYAKSLEQTVVQLVGDALRNCARAELEWEEGHATFAVNRRNNREADVPRLRTQQRLTGPVDHSVPVLAVRLDNEIRAVVFGYACHATVLSSYQWSGDYPGFAQLEVEQAIPGCTAMFWAGCGADQNPLPRREVKLAREYGKALAKTVTETLNDPMTAISGTLRHHYSEIALPLDELPTPDALQQDLASQNRYVAARARMLLAQINSGTPLSKTYPYPIAHWKLGDEVCLMFLGGEVVVDYALRTKSAYPKAWVAGYANDVMAYIPSRRVWLEGGYEGAGAMVYYGLPTRWAPQVEQLILAEVRRQMTASGITGE